MNDDDTNEVMFEYTGKTPIPDNVTHVRFHPSVTEVGDLLRDGCNSFDYRISLKEVVLNEGLKKIGIEAFHRCDSLESITFPSTLREIIDGAFKDCNNLKQIVINEGANIYLKNARH